VTVVASIVRRDSREGSTSRHHPTARRFQTGDRSGHSWKAQGAVCRRLAPGV